MVLTRSHARACALALVLLAAAYALGRPDVLVLAAPFVLAAGLGRRARDASLPGLGVALERTEAVEGDVVTAVVEVGPSEGVEVLAIVLDCDGLRQPGGDRTTAVLGLDGRPRRVELSLALERFGRFQIGPARALAFAPGLARAVALGAGATVVLDVLPAGDRFRTSSPVPHARAYAGDHRSRALAPGIEFAGIRPFAYGDALRRINWRASARHGGLLVTATHADRSAQVVVVLDTSYDAGPPGRSALDVAVRAGVAIAEHYLGAGDVVRVGEIGPSMRSLLVRGGRRRVVDVRRWLLGIDRRASGMDPAMRVRDLLVGADHALVIVLSPLVDPALLSELADLYRRGFAIVALDTLRDEMLVPPRALVDEIATALFRAERRLRLDQLNAFGVPVRAWFEGVRIDTALAGLARLAAAPRLLRR